MGPEGGWGQCLNSMPPGTPRENWGSEKLSDLAKSASQRVRPWVTSLLNDINLGKIPALQGACSVGGDAMGVPTRGSRPCQ